MVWLEANQNADGSWGEGLRKPVVTAEALLALARVDRDGGFAGRRAIGWLRNHSYQSLDHRARAVRALSAAGVDAGELEEFGTASVGWGPSAADQAVSAYDTALVIGAIRASGDSATNLDGPEATVLSRRRSADGGWGGDGIPETDGSGVQSPSSSFETAEIVRSLASQASAAELSPSLPFLETSSLDGSAGVHDLANRVAAFYALGMTGGQVDNYETLLLLVSPDGSYGSDPLVNAMVLQAIATRPGRTLQGLPTEDDDGDGCDNEEDAFPQDEDECLDTDGDGVGDNADPDVDGDGVCEGSQIHPGQCHAAEDAFPMDPTEWVDTDGDGVGNNADPDDDGDGIDDAIELAQGTNPLLADSDGDGICDGTVAIGGCTGTGDICPLHPGGVDADGDGICTPEDACDDDPREFADADGDGICDLADRDDDNDGFLDAEEIAAGTNPYDPDSTPGDLAAADPDGDADRDGLSNVDERDVYGTSPWLPDTDADGATDLAEVHAGTDPLSFAEQPRAVAASFPGISAANSSEMPPEAEGSPSLLRGTVTGGQPTPVARLGGEGDSPPAGGGLENRPGFQPQTLLGRDVDGDGLIGLAENDGRTSSFSVDTDGDRFVDGSDGFVDVSEVIGGWDLDGDGTVDGEADAGTAGNDPDDHPGKPGDVAPLGHPDGAITAGDGTVGLRLVADPSLLDTQTGQNRTIAEDAIDADEDGDVDAADALEIMKKAGGAP